MEDLFERIKLIDPLIRKETFNFGDCSILGWYHPKGFKDLGAVLKVQPLSYGKQGEFRQAMNKAKIWALELGLTSIVGPIGYSTYFDYRLKTSQLELNSFPGEPTNGVNELHCFKEFGFKALQEYCSHEIVINEKFRKKMRTMALLSFSGKIFEDFKIHRLQESELLLRANDLYRISDESFKNHLGYAPIGSELFTDQILKKILPIICWKTSFLILDSQDKCIGFSLQLRDPRDSTRVLLKTIAIQDIGKKRALIFLSICEKIHEIISPYYEKAIFCLIAKGGPTEKMVRRMQPITTEYALFKYSLE